MARAANPVPQARFAFTVVELVVATAIIAALAVALIPAIASTRASAGQSACQANQMSIGIALHGYESDYNNFLPPDAIYNYKSQLNGFDARFAYGYPAANGIVTYQMFLWPYAPSRKTWIDPAHAYFPDKAWDGGNSGTGIPNYDPIGSVDGQFWWLNYGANPNVLPLLGSYYGSNTWQLADLQTAPSATMAVMDSGSYVDAYYDPLFDAGMYYTPGCGTYGPYVDWIDPIYDAGGPWGPANTRTAWVSLWGYDPAPSDDPWTPQDANLGRRHPQKHVNSLMLDGHVQSNAPGFIQQAGAMIGGYGTIDPNVAVFYTGRKR